MSKMNRSSIVLALSAVFLLVLVGTVFVFKDYFIDALKKEKKEKGINILNITFMQLPELIVNLKLKNGNKSNILKATFSIELMDPNDKDVIDKAKPLIVDQLQTYLRELSIDDLEGASGLERVRQELKNRVLGILAPIKIRNILYNEFLIQ